MGSFTFLRPLFQVCLAMCVFALVSSQTESVGDHMSTTKIEMKSVGTDSGEISATTSAGIGGSTDERTFGTDTKEEMSTLMETKFSDNEMAVPSSTPILMNTEENIKVDSGKTDPKKKAKSPKKKDKLSPDITTEDDRNMQHNHESHQKHTDTNPMTMVHGTSTVSDFKQSETIMSTKTDSEMTKPVFESTLMPEMITDMSKLTEGSYESSTVLDEEHTSHTTAAPTTTEAYSETLLNEEQSTNPPTMANQQLVSETTVDSGIKHDITMEHLTKSDVSATTDATLSNQQTNAQTETTMDQQQKSTSVEAREMNFDHEHEGSTQRSIEITSLPEQDVETTTLINDNTDNPEFKDSPFTTLPQMDITSPTKTTNTAVTSGDDNNLSNSLYDRNQDSAIQETTESSMDSSTSEKLTTEEPLTTQKSILVETDEFNRYKDRKQKQMHMEEGQCPCNEPKMKFDPSNCFGERTVPDPTCSCRNICAQEAGEPCSQSEPCDQEFGLICSAESHTCQGQLSIQAFDVTHNSVKIKWGIEKSVLHPQAALSYTSAYRGSHTQWIEVEPSNPVTMLENLIPNAHYFVKVEEDGKQEIGIFRTKEGCIFNATLSYAVGEIFNLSCNQTCTCYSGGEPECHDRCYYIPTDTPRANCVEVPDEHDPCCVRLQCADNISGNPPKVLVTQISPSTFTVVWDDFRLPSYHSEYVLEYRVAENNNHSWIKVQAGSQPIVTVTQLKPNTPYEVRVAVWEDGDRKLELPSEVVTVYTKDGCVKDNRTYNVGDEFFYGCDLRCSCQQGDIEMCSPRCNSPYIKIGSMPTDPMCYEKHLPSDPCCVMVRCTGGKSIEVNEDEMKNKVGECPEILEDSESTTKACLSDCDHDGDCNGNLKCCPSSCGGAVCIQPLVAGNICENIYCGPNAQCVAEKMSCECADGYDGNPHDFLNGCKLSNNTKNDNRSSEGSSISPELDYGDKGDQESEFKAQTHMPTTTSKTSPPVSLENELEKNEEDNGLAVTTEVPFELDLALKSHEVSELTTNAPKAEVSQMNPVVTTEDSFSVEDNLHFKRPQDFGNDTEGRSQHRHGGDGMINKADDDQDKSDKSDMPMLFDGCEYNNITYDRGVRFEDGCEARCICDGPGHVSCVPRCSVLSSGGPSCKEVPDPDDMCCKIMVCSFPGSEETGKVDELSLKILSAQPQNGTAVRIRLALSTSKLPTMVGQDTLEVWFRVTSAKDSDLSQWNKRPVMLKELTEVQQGVFEFDVSNLMPDTDYYFKVAKESQETAKLNMAEFSNTVNAKTFPAAVKTVFQGCFHHNQSYNLGEMFYQGCEYKCICREKGFIECQDRCEIYIDTVGYEGCDWVPSEEDACCMVPSCQRRKIPYIPDIRAPPFAGPMENMCVVNNNEAYRVGDMWELDDGCKTKICRCSMVANGSTTIQCQSECPTLPPNAHIPTAHCPHPVLIKPDGPCSCPYVSCNEAPRRVVQPPRPQCEYKGKRYDMGQEFHDGCIALCHCGQDLRVNCAAIECPYHFSAEFTNCLEWDIDPDFFPTPPHCCAPSKCKNDGSCTFSGKKFDNFEDIPAELLPCGARCICVNGNVTCENRCPPVEDVPPHNLPCQPSLAYKGHPAGETCCLHWMCREPPKQSYCMFQGTRYLLSEQWEVRKGSQRRTCSCNLSNNGTPQVECKGGCPQIPQRFLLPSEQCALPVIVTPDDPVMCPYVVCNNTVSGQELYNVNVLALNSTAVRIRFTLANILVGLVGHAELHFTTDPTLQSSEWHIQKFSRPKRLFDSPNIEYILNALRPNTTYFLQVKIKIDALQTGPESELFKLRMPEEIVPTLPPSTTTLPPMIMIDAKPEAHVIDANTARISWRNFEPQEKTFIYAVQLKYKMENEAEDKWITTPMIHRDVTSYFLHDLEPSASYTVDMILTAPKELPTKLVSAKPLEFQTMGKTKDDYNLEVSVNEKKVDSESTEFSLAGIPEPISKYVHVVKILYKTPDSDQLFSFKVPKNNKVELDHLEPGKKYLAQMELYLTNGHTLTSKEVEFITKPAKLGAGASPSPEENVISGSHTNGKQAEPLQSKELKDDENRAYFIALVVVAVVAAVAGFGFILLLVLLVRRQASAKAPISRTPSESAYDNPTYKTYDGERLEDKTNGQAIQTTQA